MFSTEMRFTGVYRYASVEDLDAAITAVQALLDAEDDGFAADFDTALRRRGPELRIRLATTCAYAYEALVETLAARAIDGEVESAIDDEVTTYRAAPERKRSAVGVWWLPLLAWTSELDMLGVVS